MIRFLIRMTIILIILIYLWPDLPLVLAESLGGALGAFIGKFSSSYMNSVANGITPDWLKGISEWYQKTF